MPVVKFFACLDFERKSSFCKRLKRMKYNGDYRCSDKDLQEENERAFLLNSKKLINH
jgi:hypothetical protein